MRFSSQFFARSSEPGARSPSKGAPARGGVRPARFILGGFAALMLLPLCALATGDKVARYPFDPACPWGRLANGKGMIHRCITEDEARTLATDAPSPVNETKTGSATSVQEKPPAKDSSDEKPKAAPYDLTVGPIAADEGTITVGRLSLPVDQYRKCIDDNGGMLQPSGKVVVKFLVRAERLRAEGASAEAHENVSAKAAECIAAVVDRRKVGTPSVPMTGAKLTFSLRQKK